MRATIKINNKDRFPHTRVVAAWCNHPGRTDGNCPDSASWPCETCDHCMATVVDEVPQSTTILKQAARA